LFVIRQVVMAQYDTCAAVLGLERHNDTGGTRRDGCVVGPAPGEHEPMRRIDLDEFPRHCTPSRMFTQ
jgi:hypothetical protein